MIKVHHILNYSKNKVIDQFIITIDKGEYLSSYNKIIVFKPYSNKEIQLSKYYKNSNTTGKYRNIFLKEKLLDTERNIHKGDYILVDKILIE